MHVFRMNHFWSTCSGACEASLTVRYYIDGEANASIEFHPGMAAGVGFNDDQVGVPLPTTRVRHRDSHEHDGAH